MNGYRIFVATFCGLLLIAVYYYRGRAEKKLALGNLEPGKNSSLPGPLFLLLALGARILLRIILDMNTPLDMALWLALIVVNISLYYTLCILLLPLLRRLISPRACAALWLVPAILYTASRFFESSYQRSPLLTLTLPKAWLIIFLWVWLAGFALLTLGQLLSHLRFRRSLLADAAEFSNPALLRIWRVGLRRHGVMTDIPILVTGAISTPLTIGCFEGALRLVLPKRAYSQEELKLIFSHELRHILRWDSRVKLFISFCAALCWYNPLVWVARRMVADDLELSCDQGVLEGADQATRRQYAELLLKSAGQGQGYTTCLSGAAGSMRYRLRNVVRPAKRLPGGLVVGMAAFGLVLALGLVEVTAGPGPLLTLVNSPALF